MATGVQTKTTLAPALGAVTAISMGKDIKSGEVEAVEIGSQVPGQMSFAQETQPVAIDGQIVDPSTGEIIEDNSVGNKVVDLRTRQA